MDIMHGLASPSIAVRKKVMEICLSGSMVNSRNVADVVGVLKKELIKTGDAEAQHQEGNAEYRRLLLKSLHTTTAKFSDHASSVMLRELCVGCGGVWGSF